MATFDTLWRNHPYPKKPCDGPFINQCAIRMGIALQASGISTATFKGAKCWQKHSPRHILRAEELANWLHHNFNVPRTVHRNVTYRDFVNRKGIVFIKDGWANGGDHIDLWDGTRLKGGQVEYFELGAQIWFWELS